MKLMNLDRRFGCRNNELWTNLYWDPDNNLTGSLIVGDETKRPTDNQNDSHACGIILIINSDSVNNIISWARAPEQTKWSVV